ncbi:DUF2946 family protein [Hydrogenophaga sp. BPS33]|uniref:DUF2946 family protein n=1 Tax=Hydrogenophaga sp. BPS33 TaxID=2651974 RepID=UPI00131FB1E7|nr:DUF2946 family protein [Hydrogenophaga sp. BPS33]QHE87713.1 DUF2946 domain-containing protein [Hydrogenophaga sp. BPS33]
MPFTRATRRFAAWLAMLAWLLGALAPTVAQAVVSSQGHAGWVQVCSASGMVWRQVDAVDGDTSGDTSGDMGASFAEAQRHCPALNGALGLPPAPPASPHAFGTHAEAPQAPIRSATPASPWPTALSRAPPPQA